RSTATQWTSITSFPASGARKKASTPTTTTASSTRPRSQPPPTGRSAATPPPTISSGSSARTSSPRNSSMPSYAPTGSNPSCCALMISRASTSPARRRLPNWLNALKARRCLGKTMKRRACRTRSWPNRRPRKTCRKHPNNGQEIPQRRGADPRRGQPEECADGGVGGLCRSRDEAADPGGLCAAQSRSRSAARLARQGRGGLVGPGGEGAAALHPGEDPPQGDHRGPEARQPPQGRARGGAGPLRRLQRPRPRAAHRVLRPRPALVQPHDPGRRAAGDGEPGRAGEPEGAGAVHLHRPVLAGGGVMMLKLWVANTDPDWFDYLYQCHNVDEVNFWQPSGNMNFRAVESGDLFLFKLKSPRNAIGGYGVFAEASILPVSLAWEAFGFKNGVASYSEMRQRIGR